MTKGQIERALEGLPDDTPFLIVSEGGEQRVVNGSELYRLDGNNQVALILFALGAPRVLAATSPMLDHLNRFAAWARAETDASTVGEAVAEVSLRHTLIKEWELVKSTRLEHLADLPDHPYEILDDWAGGLPIREREIFWKRVSVLKPESTLAEIGTLLEVTRERVRQLEKRVRKRLHMFLKQEEARPIHWRAKTIRDTLGTAFPMNAAEPILRAPGSSNDYRSILLELAGPYTPDMFVQNSGWLVCASARRTDPTETILSQADEFGRIDREQATAQLREWGIRDSLHEAWLTRSGDIRVFNSQLVRWGGSVGDRMAFALADIGCPATLEEMMCHIGENRNRRSVSNAMYRDPRLVQVDRNPTRWGLASWDLPVYERVVDLIRDLLEESDGSMPIDGIVWHIQRDFNIKETTIWTYCSSAPMFVTENGVVRLRTEEDEPYRLDPDSIRRAQGVFHLGPGRVGRLFSVDEEILRGSGRLLTHAAGAILDVGVNDNLIFTNEHGHTVMVTFPESSIVGPSIGSIRQIAEHLSAQAGDLLTLILDRSDMSIAAYLTDPANYEPSWGLVGRLTGIATPSSMEDIASALQCDQKEVRSLLRSRGDEEVLKALPVLCPDVGKSHDRAVEETREPAVWSGYRVNDGSQQG
ncbi:MAG: hypothetical protein OXC09_13870 [Truepera sp.]|nr:hypothetical protein [Truepera sp.]